jgi:2-C-methyl-D-erythritol 4-phosphate cytidylyltransferase
MDCLYLAAGLGKRLRKEKPKQFLHIFNKPLFIYALEVLEKVEKISRIVMTYHPDLKILYQKYLEEFNISRVEMIEGGHTRQDSVWRGLQRIRSARFILHEAARPFLSKHFIHKLLTYKDDTVIPTVSIPFTVSLGGKYMEASLDRSQLHNIQLPQVFKTQVLVQAHKKAQSDNFLSTEDGILVFRLGKKVRFVDGLESNIKITTPLDLVFAETLLKHPQHIEGR